MVSVLIVLKYILGLFFEGFLAMIVMSCVNLDFIIIIGRLLNSLGPIDVKKLYLSVLILLLRAFRSGSKLGST